MCHFTQKIYIICQLKFIYNLPIYISLSLFLFNSLYSIQDKLTLKKFLNVCNYKSKELLLIYKRTFADFIDLQIAVNKGEYADQIMVN